MGSENEKTDIIVVGYPKSGNTWMTRLVAELVGCPVVGFLDYKHQEIAQEGDDRESDFQCFKSHYQLHELCESKSNSAKVIYVVRDPRDVSLSGVEYFTIRRWPRIYKFLKKLLRGYSLRDKIGVLFVSSSTSYRIKRMVNAVLYGAKDINIWVRIPWATHYKAYIDDQHFFVKYEDLLSDPLRECKRIINYLNLEREDDHLVKVIENQSFKNKKQKFIDANELDKAKFLRAGKKEQWRDGLSEKYQNLFNEMLADDLKRLGYPTSK